MFFDPAVPEILINGISNVVPNDVSIVHFFGDGGNDKVVCLDRPNERDWAVLEDNSMSVTCDSIRFFAHEITELEFRGGDSDDIAVIYDSVGNDVIRTFHNRTMLQSEISTLLARHVANVYVFGGDGNDQVAMRGGPDSDQLLCNMGAKRARMTSADFFVSVNGFDRLLAISSAGGLDKAKCLGSNQDDIAYCDGPFTRMYNDVIDYRFRQFGVFDCNGGAPGDDLAILGKRTNSDERHGNGLEPSFSARASATPHSFLNGSGLWTTKTCPSKGSQAKAASDD